MASEIKFILDGSDRGQPTNAIEFGFTISEEIDIKTRVVSFNNDLIFSGAAYDYLFTLLVNNGICNLVDVNVLYECQGIWKNLVNGYLIVSELIFDFDRCTCRTKMYDTSFSTRINNNKDIPFSLNSLKTKNLYPKSAANIVQLEFFNPSNCVTNTIDTIGGYSVWEAFKNLIASMSDNLIDFQSDFFRIQTFGLASRVNYFVTTGKSIADKSSSVDAIVSFKQLFSTLDSKLNLGIGFTRQSNGRPLMRIEPASFFYEQNSIVNLYDQPDITLSVDKTQLYGTIRLGASESLQFNECNNGDSNCQFVQTPVDGFEENTFGFLGTCNTGTALNLVSNEVIIDTNIIEDTYIFNSDAYLTNTFIIEIKYNFQPAGGGQPAKIRYLANKQDPYEQGNCYYNISLNNLASSFNWRTELHNSIAQYQEPYTPASTNFNVRVSSNLSFVITPTTATYFETTDQYIKYLDEVTDVGNNFSVDKYVVPRAGQYTFDVEIFTFCSNSYSIQAIIQRFNSNDEFVGQVVSSTQNSTGGILSATITLTAVFNQGDIIRTDLQAVSGNGGNQTLIIQNIFSANPSIFYGSGTPFENEFQVVDPNASKKILYKFDRPLTMTEIEAILDNTSQPIAFGRWDDPQRTIEGYIKKVDVKSIIEQEASFELKSNKILR
jgi:hypothetical protein